MSKKSLRFQITLFVSAAMIIASGVALWTIDHVISAQKARAQENMQVEAMQAGGRVAIAMSEHEKAVRLAGANRFLNAAALNQVVKAYPEFALALVTDKSGRVIAANTLDAEGKALNTGLFVGRVLADKPWFVKSAALSAGAVYVEDFADDALVSEMLGKTEDGNGFSTPLFDDKGKFNGVVTFRADEAWAKSSLAAYFATLGQNGLFNPRLSMRNAAGKTILKFGPDEGQERMASGHAAMTGNPDIEAMKWELYVAFPYNQMFGDIESTRGFFYIMEILLACIGMGAAYLFGGRLLNTINVVSSRLDHQSESVNEIAAHLADSSQQLSASVSEQAGALQRTVASVDQVSAMISKNADNAAQSQNVSRENLEAASRGQKVVTEMITSIEEINRSNGEIMRQIEEGNQEIANIVKVIMEIGDKTKVINDIVFQTKLLSFNASVEAARAGEHGKGFAVVAEEVGNLAAMSGNAAKEISDMLNGSIEKVQGIVKNTADRVAVLVSQGRSKVEAGTVTARRCGETLNEIVANVSRVDGLLIEITTASKEQAQGAAEITKAMNQLDQVIQENAAMAKDTSTTATNLRGQAGEVEEALAQLKSAVFGSNAPDPVAVTAPAPQAAHPAPAPVKVAKVTKMVVKPAAKKAALKKTAPAKAATKNNVLPLRPKSKTEAPAPKKAVAVSTSLGVPSADDDRFEEI